MSWELVGAGMAVFVVWDAYVAQPMTLLWDNLGHTVWDTIWDDGATVWEDPPATWIA